ncbi:MAG: hypothetical protein OEV78_12205 [Spirochaetia bacterium]|nr:hypothetical protein [Spirochaetia bacterium]
MPTINPASITAAGGSYRTVTVTVPVDKDTGLVYVLIRDRSFKSVMNYIPVSAGSVQDVSVPVTIPDNTFVAGSYVYVEIYLSTSLASAQMGNFNIYGFATAAKIATGTTYDQVSVVAYVPSGSVVDTGVSMTTLTIDPTPNFVFTNGDGKAELTALPAINPAAIATNILNSVTVTVPVDTDTGYVQACLIDRANSATFLCATPGTQPTAGTQQNVNLTISPPANTFAAGNFIYVKITTAVSLATATNGTLYDIPNASSNTTYQKTFLTAGTGTPAYTGVPATILKIGSGITFANGDGKPQLTAAPTITTASITGSAGGTVSINVPIDSDTGAVQINLKDRANQGMSYTSGWFSVVTPGTAQIIGMTVVVPAGAFTAGAYVYAEVWLATTVTAATSFGNTNNYGLYNNLTGTTYEEMLFTSSVGGVAVDTCVPLSKLTIN